MLESINNLNTEQCAGGREIKQIGSETEQSEINWQVCGNLDTKVVFLVSEWKKDYLNDIEAIDNPIGRKSWSLHKQKF